MEIPPDKNIDIDQIADRLLMHANQIKASVSKKKSVKRKKNG
jgi:hypothetical protein